MSEKLLTVKDLKRILKSFKDTDLVSVYGVENSERHLIEERNIDECIEGQFEINIGAHNRIG